MMKRKLQLVAGAIAFVGLVVWLFGGPNLGWTKTSIPREVVDEVTGLTQVVWERTFLPGVDFLAVALAAATLFLAAAKLVGRAREQRSDRSP